MKSRTSFIKVLCILEGFKSVCKEFHWMEDNSHQHELFNDCGNEIADFQDTFAEQGFTIWGKIMQGELVAVKPVIPTPEEFFDCVVSFATGVSSELNKYNVGNKLDGLENISAEFISTMRKFVYLGDMD